MNKSDLVESLSEKTDLSTRKAQEVVDMVFDTMSRGLMVGDRIEVQGFGSFTIRKYGGDTARNPRTVEKTVVKAKMLPFF